MEELSFYDQLTCTVGRSIVCKECLIKDDELYMLYTFSGEAGIAMGKLNYE